jgi:hypothetical protein
LIQVIRERLKIIIIIIIIIIMNLAYML